MRYALVNTMIAPVMKEADFFSERVDELIYGMKIELLEHSEMDWYFIKTHYNYTGYVHVSMIYINDEKFRWPNEFHKMVVIQPFADILQRETIKSTILITVTKGSILCKVEEADVNGYVKVVLNEGDVGFIKENFISEYEACKCEVENELRNRLVNTALSYYGTQYRWGGKTPQGIDCSGLCSMAYMLNGIIIYRDAKIMEGFPVKEIPISKVKMGDLLYLPGHIAMYIGNYNYVHATAKNGSDGVVINSLNPADDNYREDLALSLYAVGSIFYN